MELGKPEDSDDHKLIEKGYQDMRCVLLRNGGMYQRDEGTKTLRNYFWKSYPVIQHATYTFLLFGILGYGLYAERRNVDNLLEAFHYLVMIISLTCGNVDFLYYRKALDSLLKDIGMEFFKYDEDEPEVYKELKRANRKEVQLVSTAGLLLYLGAFAFISFFQPTIYYAVSRGENLQNATLNPYLPLPIHLFWDAFTVEGFIYGAVIEIIGATIVVLNVIANGFSYVNLMILFRCQLQILNHSIKNIDARAIEKYRRKYGITPDKSHHKNEALQKCYVECLKSNIRHHQCLLSWLIRSRKMIRVILLFVFFNASILMASTGYLLSRNFHSTLRTIKFLQLLAAEIIHTFLFCFYGEQVAHQSEELFDNLYGMQWFNYGKEFNLLLKVMMSMTVRPLRSLTAIFNTPCSLETFNNLMSTAYSYFSLINGMKAKL